MAFYSDLHAIKPEKINWPSRKEKLDRNQKKMTGILQKRKTA